MTLFPTEQVKNLYVGPLEFTPAGQSLSLVGFHNPDFDKYPLFKEALDHALVADLEPGDAVYIPSLWWHHVEGLDNFNMLVNYWWRDAEDHLESPMNAFLCALLTVPDFPESERRAWKALFDFYIFRTNGDPIVHLPTDVRGVLGKMTVERAKKIRASLLKALNR